MCAWLLQEKRALSQFESGREVVILDQHHGEVVHTRHASLKGSCAFVREAADLTRSLVVNHHIQARCPGRTDDYMAAMLQVAHAARDALAGVDEARAFCKQ